MGRGMESTPNGVRQSQKQSRQSLIHRLRQDGPTLVPIATPAPRTRLRLTYHQVWLLRVEKYT